MADSEYECHLDAASLKVAQTQLHENPKERLGQVETFRQWIKEQKHITVPTDIGYLLKFLRVAKFSQLEARSVLEAHLKAKTKHPELLDDVDFSHPEFIRILQTGHMLALPKRDHLGRKIMVLRYGLLDPDPKKWNRDDIAKFIFGMVWYSIMNENVQANGFAILQDFSHSSVKFITFVGLDALKKNSSIFQGKYPGRFKELHFYNSNAMMEALMQMLRPMLKQKFKERLHITGKSLENLYKHIPMEYLPVEYLPDDYTGPNQGSLDQIRDDLLKEFQDTKLTQKILYETSAKWKYDFKLKPEEEEPRQSFRQLSVE